MLFTAAGRDIFYCVLPCSQLIDLRENASPVTHTGHAVDTLIPTSQSVVKLSCSGGHKYAGRSERCELLVSFLTCWHHPNSQDMAADNK